MDYNKHYNNLISRAKSRVLLGYTESHHIIPRCMGGTDEQSNLVRLTPEEHYVAHQLLVKIYPEDKKLVKAAMMMVPNRPSNKIYGWLRKRFSEAQSLQQTGNGNSQFGTRWIFNNELKISKKIPKGDKLPEGWLEGRKQNFNKSDRELQKELNLLESIKRNKEYKEHTIKHLKLYLQSDFKSLNEYCVDNYEFSLVTLTKRLKRYVPEYNDISKQGCHNIKELLMGVKL